MQLRSEELVIREFNVASSEQEAAASLPFKTAEELAAIVSKFSATDDWWKRVRLRTDGRWYERLYCDSQYDIWAISWMPGQGTGYHDHGGSAGAFVIATGVLEEHSLGDEPILVPAGQARAFDSDYLHDVRNTSSAPAVSIHAYSPPLNEMNHYELEDGGLIAHKASDERDHSRLFSARGSADSVGKTTGKLNNGSGIDQMLSAARGRLKRLSAHDAQGALRSGAILVDIRPQAQRDAEGRIPGALVIERNVLEWRFDPASEARHALATDYDLHIIVFCSEGYTSSLAAASLQEVGLWRATDLVGGFQAWRAAGLATELL